MSSRITLADLPEPYRAQAEAQLGRQVLYLAAASQLPCLDAPRPATGKISRVPSKTEMAFYREFLSPHIRAGFLLRADYERLTLRITKDEKNPDEKGKHRYTPDWVAYDYNGRCHCYEVKGSYKLESYQRSRLAFDQARIEWKYITFYWYERNENGEWRMK